MKVTPLNAPAPVPGVMSDHQRAASKREAAIKAFTGEKPQAQETPVQNPNKITAEELGAIKAKSPADGQAQAVEPKAEVTAAPKPEETPLSSQYAQLARKEKALRAQAQSIKAREDALKLAEAPKAPQREEIDPAKYISIEEFRKSPFKYLQQTGVTYDQVTQEALNAPSPEAMQMMQTVEALKAEIQALKTDQEGTKKNYAEQQDAQYKQAVNQIRAEVKQLVFTNDAYEACKATNSVDDVVELIEKTFKEDGYLMSVEDATKQVEDYLEEEAYKLSQLKKIQARLKPKGQEDPAAKEANQDPKQPQKTLSNAMSGSRQLTARERALAAAQHGPSWREKT